VHTDRLVGLAPERSYHRHEFTLQSPVAFPDSQEFSGDDSAHAARRRGDAYQRLLQERRALQEWRRGREYECARSITFARAGSRDREARASDIASAIPRLTPHLTSHLNRTTRADRARRSQPSM